MPFIVCLMYANQFMCLLLQGPEGKLGPPGHSGRHGKKVRTSLTWPPYFPTLKQQEARGHWTKLHEIIWVKMLRCCVLTVLSSVCFVDGRLSLLWLSVSTVRSPSMTFCAFPGWERPFRCCWWGWHTRRHRPPRWTRTERCQGKSRPTS